MQTATPARDEACAFDGKIETWVDDECAACVFKDVRLKRQFVALMKSIARIIGGSIPFVCQDWANTKAAYRFLSNERVSEADILAGPQGVPTPGAELGIAAAQRQGVDRSCPHV